MGIFISNPESRALARGVGGWLLLGALAGCGTVDRVYTLHPQQGMVHPHDESWGLDVAVEVTDAIHIQVANASQDVVRIAWDDCAYIDVEGESHRLLRERAAKRHDEGPQVATAIAPGAHIKETLHPIEGKVLEEPDPLLPSRGKSNPEGGWLRRLLFLKPKGEHPSVGKTVGVALVFERGTDRMIKTLTTTYLISQIRTDHHWW